MVEPDKECLDRFRINGKLRMPFEATNETTYMYLGHGHDRCDEEGNLIIKTVPEDCIYITETVCGIQNRIPTEVFRAFSNPDYAHIWKDPFAHMEEIRALFVRRTNFHIHMPGCTYVDSTFYGINEQVLEKNEQGQPTKIKLALSGLMPLDYALIVSEDNLSQYFAPTQYNLAELELFTSELYGYFNFNLFPQIPEGLKTTLEKVKPLYYDMFRSYEGMRKPVSELMAEHPGIHFNFLCRSVGEECKPAAIRRRRHSAVVQKTNLNTLRKLANIQNETMTNENMLASAESMSNFLTEKKNFLTLLYGSFQKYPRTLAYLKSFKGGKTKRQSKRKNRTLKKQKA